MKTVISWAIRNGAGINFLVLAILLVGLGAFFVLRRETFPEFQLEVILVSVPYPGATPDEVESGICQKIEEAVRPLTGIKKLSSICREGSGFTLAQLESSVKDPQRVLSEIRSAVDRISVYFPERSEKPTVEQITFRLPAISLAVIGPADRSQEADWRLRNQAESIRERLLELPSVSQVQLVNAKPYQIDIEIDESTLREYGLTLTQIASLIRRENIELPGGQLKSEGQEILLRGKNRREIGEDIAQLPLVTKPNGVVLRVADLGHVRDDFDDISAVNEVNGQPAMVLRIERTSNEDLLNIADEVHSFAAKTNMPAGYRLQVFADQSIDVRDRMRMLRDNGIQGGIVVFILLALFLNVRLAFWVAMGIPISLMGAAIILYFHGDTLNMLTMFAFLMAVGIVVDDAIVVGENIYAHRMLNKSYLQAAVDGASEVLPSVISSVLTTIIAFMPLFFVSGVMGKFIAVMPLAIIAMLVISLLESSFALPGHLAHEPRLPRTTWQKISYTFSRCLKPLERWCGWLGSYANRGLDRFGEAFYLPLLKISLQYPQLPLAVGGFAVLIAVGLVRSAVVPFEFFPDLDGKVMIGQITYPDGTPASVTSESVRRMEAAVRQLSERIASEEAAAGTNRTPEPTDPLSPRGPIRLTFLQIGSANRGEPAAGDRASGSHVGQVEVELHDAALRNVTRAELIRRWREAAGEFPGAERVTFQSQDVGPGGKPIEFKILAPREEVAALEAAVEAAKKALAKFDGVYDISDDSTPGKTEYQLSIQEDAQALGVKVADLAETVRNAYYGAEVMRLQRGRHEVKLMVRYPPDERRSLLNFDEIRVRGDDGIERPITELAEITPNRGYSEINRLDQMRSITVSAEIDTTRGNAALVANALKQTLVPEWTSQYPSLRFRWEGQQQETAESFTSLLVGFIIAMLSMYLLLVFEFSSYLQPLIILAIIPFSFVGAIYGHALMGISITLFSIFGMVTLAGVVVNDSIVLVDFINQCIRQGQPIGEALLTAGGRRLRAVFLTSVTTVAGLTPTLLEKSFQAQFLVPMATSLAFGLMASTALVLLLVPLLYSFYVRLTFERNAKGEFVYTDPDHETVTLQPGLE